jgi:hypothetical protein
MALTGIAIYLDKPEYSRLETNRSVVRARVVPAPATGLVSETVGVALMKKGVPIYQTTVAFNGDTPKGTVIDIDLKEIKDADGVTHITRGKYQLTATQGSISATATVTVALITAVEMRRTYCQGLHLVAGSKLAPKKQPSVVTGIWISNVSKSSKAGLKALEYNATTNALTWGGGTATPLDDTSSSEILMDAKGGYIEVEIDHFNLPGTDASEAILIDQDALDDDFLHREIEKATQEIELALKVFLEPTRIATAPYFQAPEQGEYFDVEAEALCYYEKDFNMRGLAWQLNLPYHQVSKIEKIAGYIGNSKALEISSGALSVNRKSGVANVLPHNSQYSAFYTFFMTLNFWGNREFIPAFWRYKAVAGIEETTPGDILKLIGYTAAMSILTTAEQAYRAGVSSESISKDGVSRSTSYNAKGIYDTTIQEYKDWLKTNTPKLRNIYRGIPMVTV